MLFEESVVIYVIYVIYNILCYLCYLCYLLLKSPKKRTNSACLGGGLELFVR